MAKKTTYEWDIETICPVHEDVLDHNHADKLSEFYEPLDIDQRLVLVRDVWDDWGLIDRVWAYVSDDGKLDEFFSEGFEETTLKPPKRFHAELAKHTERLGITSTPSGE